MRWLLWLYPRRWRQRYGDELAAMLAAEHGFSLRVLLDVVRGALDAWLHPELAGPAATLTGAPLFEQFTPRSRAVLALARDEARRQRDAAIRAEHVLLGLLVDGHGLAVHMLSAQGVDIEQLDAALRAHMSRGGAADVTPTGLSPDTKRVLRESVAQAKRLRHGYVGTEHLLLGLVADGRTTAAQLLRDRNVSDVAKLRHSLMEILHRARRYTAPPPS